MRKTVIVVCLALFAAMFFSMPRTAQAKACYSPVEAEAEQGIRIHSELMVIGLNCQHMGAREGMNLYGQYRQFTADNGDLFAAYEKILLRYFKNAGYGDPEAQINTLRTGFANKISNDAAKMRPDVFCSRYAPRITKAAEMKQVDLRKWAATIYPSHPVSAPLCAGAAG
ncbi:MAG: hypothetical protein R3D66_04485 [Alphaproteobacteria bacterium]